MDSERIHDTVRADALCALGKRLPKGGTDARNGSCQAHSSAIGEGKLPRTQSDTTFKHTTGHPPH
jgi:hypothetical protein